MIAAGRLSGARIPWPETVRLDEAERIAVWVAETVRLHSGCLLVTHVSKAVRVCLAAREVGIDLNGATFLGGGEPPSEAKIREITRTGARWVPMYPFSEYGIVGVGCANPADENDVHLLNDGLALTQFPRPMPGSDILVDAFNFTTLLPTAPKIFLNVESDDYGLVEERQCGCLLEQYGYPLHVRHIRSFSKLTGEGGTLVGSEMIRILEDVLPSRFGGTALDFQLLEEEGENGLTRLSLLVHPRLQIENESAVVRAVLEELQPKSSGPGTGSFAAEITRNTWQQAQTLRVKRMAPILTGHGKMMPLHTLRRSDPKGS
jgi:hypothetical protein